jgi:hypothetical protein
MSGRHHPVPAHQRAATAGAMPASATLAEVEQEEVYHPKPVDVCVVGPVTMHKLPARRAATQTVVVGLPQGGMTATLGTELKRSRAVICSVDAAFFYAVRAQSLQSASTAMTAATIWPPNVPLVIENADQVFLACAGLASATSSTIGVVIETWAD